MIRAGTLIPSTSAVKRDAEEIGDGNRLLDKAGECCRRALDFLESITTLRAVKGRVESSEEKMLSLRPYTALSTAAARPFNRPSDWRRSCVGMPKHQITSEQGRSLPLG